VRASALILGAGLLLLAKSAAAEDSRIELDAALGFRFGGGADVEAEGAEGRVTIADEVAFTAIAGYRVQPNGFVYLNYTRQTSTLRYLSDDLQTNAETPFSTDVIHLGGNLEMPRGRVVPYLGFSIGATRFGSMDLGYDSWAFSMALDGGVKIDLTEWLHLRFLGRIPFTFATSEAGAFCLSPVGCVVLVSGGPIVQGEVYAGLGLTF
jgi:hypothetical protein